MSDFKFTFEEKRQMKIKIQHFFEESRNEKLGDLASELIFDFISRELGPLFYNIGINDAYKLMNYRVEELFELEK